MRVVLTVVAALLSSSPAFAQKDEPKTDWSLKAGAERNVPDELAAGWRLDAAVQGKESFSASNSEGKPPWIKMSGNGIGWESFPVFFPGKGAALARFDTSAKPARIEVKLGDKIIRGIYTFAPDGKKVDKNRLLFLFAEPGADFPKEFGPDGWSAPKEFKGTAIWFVREP